MGELPTLRIATAGSVDDGKSTLIGRLLHDTSAVLDDQLRAVERASRRWGDGELNLALLTDGLRAEREQGITIDVAHRYFSTPRRSFVVADSPGHAQYTRNMVTAASSADVAVVLVDARRGVVEQTRRHAFVAALVGVGRIILAVNKMDLIGWDDADCRAIAKGLTEYVDALPSPPPVDVVPISGAARRQRRHAVGAQPVVRRSTTAGAARGGPSTACADGRCPSRRAVVHPPRRVGLPRRRRPADGWSAPRRRSRVDRAGWAVDDGGRHRSSGPVARRRRAGPGDHDRAGRRRRRGARRRGAR